MADPFGFTDLPATEPAASPVEDAFLVLDPQGALAWANQRVLPGYRMGIFGKGRIEIWTAGDPPRAIYRGYGMADALHALAEEVDRLTRAPEAVDDAAGEG
ncbi:MAG: hypothetical protein GC191_07985 [Azospirillum sp.]|nr:hypothetical protein [Azospirillum sp.]